MAFKFENLKIWKESIEFTKDVYNVTKKFPKDEKFGLVSQLNRSVVSICANIAEGEGRQSDLDQSRFIQISIGSLNEVVTLLYVSKEQKFINQNNFIRLYEKSEKISKMLHAFKKYLKQ